MAAAKSRCQKIFGVLCEGMYVVLKRTRSGQEFLALRVLPARA
jgi:hypothetical protein